jgi:hypothetical protein
MSDINQWKSALQQTRDAMLATSCSQASKWCPPLLINAWNGV